MVEEVISFSFSFSEILTLTVNFRVGAGTIDSVVFFCFATHSLTLSRSLSLSLSLALALRFSLSLASVFFFLRNAVMQIYRGNLNARLLILFVSVSSFSSPHIDIAYPACLDCLPHFRSSIIPRSRLSKRRTPNKKGKKESGANFASHRKKSRDVPRKGRAYK